MKKALVYLQEVGGTRYLMPALLRLLARHPVTLVSHPMAEKVLREHKLDFQPLSAFAKTPPVSDEDLEKALRFSGISHVICTASAPQVDETNTRLVRLCRRMGIPVLGGMDHWKKFDRFFDEQGRPSYVPQWACCVDEECRKGFQRFGCMPEQVRVVGHPHLEELWRTRECFAVEPGRRPIRILVVSQLVFSGGRFHSIFSDNFMGIWSQVMDTLGDGDGSIEISYRPHPKEPAGTPLPDGVRDYSKATWEQALRDHDVFLGIDSVMLIEAALAGRQCVSLALPELITPFSIEIPYPFAAVVRRPEDVGTALRTAVARASDGAPVDTGAVRKMFEGSTDRMFQAFEDFLKV